MTEEVKFKTTPTKPCWNCKRNTRKYNNTTRESRGEARRDANKTGIQIHGSWKYKMHRAGIVRNKNKRKIKSYMLML